MSKYTFLVPVGFDLDRLIQTFPPNIALFKPEKVLYILDVLAQVPARNHDAGDDKDGYVPLNASVLRDNIGNKYHLYLDWLVKSGVLECNGYFSVDKQQSRKYKLTPLYDTDVHGCTIDISEWMKRKVTVPVPAAVNTPNWWEYSLTVPECAALKDKLPTHSSGLNQSEQAEYNDWMRQLYPALFKWYDINGLQIDTTLAAQYNDTLWRLREHAIVDAEKRWNRKSKVWLPKSHTNQLRSNSYNIHDFTRQNYYPHFDPNVLRLYSSLVSFNKEFRPAISWRGAPMVAIDISNSQPYLLAALLTPDFWINDGRGKSTVTLYNLPYHTNYTHLYPIADIITLCNFLEQTQPADVVLFRQIVTSGKFYERLCHMIPKPKGRKPYERADMKTLMFKVLFTKNEAIDQGWAKAKRDFASLFPNVNALIRLIQSTGNANLPCLLQRLESHLMYNHVVPRISCELKDAPIFTIHDSIVTTVGNERRVANILREELYYAIGNMPSYKYEYWNADKIQYALGWYETLFEHVLNCFEQSFAPTVDDYW